MRVALLMLIVGGLVAGCGGSSSPSSSSASPKPTGLPTARSAGTSRIEKIPTAKAIVFPTATGVPDSQYTATIYGTISDAKTGSPISGAVVKVGVSGAHETTTNSFGKYRIAFPGSAAVPVTVTIQGYASPPAMGRLAPHASYRLDFKLSPEKAGKPVIPPPPVVFGNR